MEKFVKITEFLAVVKLSSINNNNNKITRNLIFQNIPQTKYVIDVLCNDNLSFQALSV